MSNRDGECTVFEEQIERIKDSTATQTQVELANVLGIRQSDISAARRNGKIPVDWLVFLRQTRNVNPEWILSGNSPCHVSASPMGPGSGEPD